MLREILKSHKAYKAKIKKLEDELFNTKFDYSNKVRELEGSLNFSRCELNRLQRELDRNSHENSQLSHILIEVKQELVEAKAKYVNLVNKKYEE